MNKKFTKLIAALALLTFFAVPMGMRGQSRESITASYGWEDADDASQWTISSAIVKTSGQGNTGTYAGKINTNTTTVQYNDKVNVTSFSYAFKRTSTNSNYSVYIQTSTDGQTWNTVDTQAMSSFNNGTYKTVTKTFDGNTAYYVRFYCNNTTATRYVDDVTIVYNTTASTTFTVNYDCNGGETNCPENVSGIAPSTSITLPSAPSRQHYNFEGWTYGATTYNPGESYTVNSNVTFVAQWEPDGTYGEGSICFSNQSSCTAINSQSVTGEDDLGNTWTITTAGTSSFTANSGYYQVGSGNSPATSITFTTILDEEVNVTDFSATFGGFNATRASVALKVDNTQVGSGTLNGGDDVTVSSSSVQIGTTLTVIVTPTAGGVKCYNISYAYETIDNPAVATTTTINVPQNFNTDIYQGTTAGTLTATVSAEGTPISGATVTWSSSNTGVATIDANGEVTLVAVGTTTITASYAGIEDEYRPSTGTYELTVTDSNAPGTQNNPYTVAQARAAIDVGTGTQGVYATGIVSAIPTAWNTQYNNITFNFVDNAGDNNFLQAYRCVSGTGVDASTVAVGDIAVVYGNLTKYGSTYEFGQGCQLVSLTHPVVVDPIVTVTPNSINAPFAGAEGTLDLTYENIEEFISFDYYFCDANGNELEGDDPDWIYAEINEENDAYTLSYIIDANDGAARTAYIKVYTYDDNLEEIYDIVTVNQEEYVAPTYAELPFAFNNGRAAIEETDGLSQEGLGTDYNANSNPNTKLKFDGTGDWLLLQFDERPGTLTFDIKGNGFSGGTFTVQTSEDGVIYTDLENYTDFGASGNDLKEEETFGNLGEDVRYIKWIYTNKSSGNVGLGNIALDEYVTPEPAITVTPATLDVNAAEHDGTLDLTYTSLTITDMSDFDIQFCDANGDELSEEPDWIEVLVAEQDPEIGDGYVVSYYMFENEDAEARTAYFKVYAMDDETNLVYSNLVTINQAAPVTLSDGYLYERYSGDLVEGDYVVYFQGYAMKNEVANNRLSYSTITPSKEDVIATSDASIVWHIAPRGDYWVIYNAAANAYAASNGTRNQAQMLADGTDDKALWTVSGDYEFVNKYNSENSVNANLRENGIYGFACYLTSTGGALSLYKKMEAVTETYTLNVPAHQWCFISSPTGIAPANINDLTDLYYYDEQEHYWRNKKVYNNLANFDFDYGKGYLCAYHINGEDNPIALTFIGTPAITENAMEIALDYHEQTSGLAGWNLVGNPFASKATLNMPCYTISGMAINTNANPANETQINPCEGVMVQATGEGQNVIFTKVADDAPAPQPNQLQLTVAQNVTSRGDLTSIVNDNAIVSFREGCQLEKFVFNADAAKLYIPLDNKEYAIVSTDVQGEMFVNFKATENGSYTLTVNPEGVEMNYLHLIDNLTSTDIDLLAAPSYTFEARTTDYESRFKLVFATGSNSDDDSFAFFSNGQLIVSNDGKATLQVIDLTGRILSSETINGSCSKTFNVPAGVYMLRLLNGDVKVQKVVVR